MTTHGGTESPTPYIKPFSHDWIMNPMRVRIASHIHYEVSENCIHSKQRGKWCCLNYACSKNLVMQLFASFLLRSNIFLASLPHMSFPFYACTQCWWKRGLGTSLWWVRKVNDWESDTTGENFKAKVNQKRGRSFSK